jgi:predicted acetyltransferase
MTMDVALVSAGRDDARVLSRLFQLYVYDFSEILELEIRDDGLFEFGKPDGYWDAPRYSPFLIRAGSHLAGFAVVDSQSRLTHEPLWDVNQFFVLRRHRRTGVGSRAAVALFDQFPGRWEVRQAPENEVAQSFWRNVIRRYTRGRFEETVHNDGTWRGPVQRFDNGRAR